MRDKLNEWQESEVMGGDCQVKFNVATGDIVLYCNDFAEFTADTLMLFVAELRRKGMYDG